MNPAYASLFDQTLNELGLEKVSPETEEKFELYCARLLEKNQVMNLTALRTPEEVFIRHFADSIAAAGFIGTPGTMIDIGCGAGFPGLPLKLYLDGRYGTDIRLTLLDSTAKKIDFLRDLTNEMGLSHVSFETRRAEEAAHDPQLRGSFDAVVSRAVAAFPELCEICIPFAAPGGIFAAHKSGKAADEILLSRRAVSVLGGKEFCSEKYLLNGTENLIVTVKKGSPSPDLYPRIWSKIKKKPLI